MKRKRDLQGKFTRKNQTERQVRSLRLTDSTWKELGIASECLGITRADLLENLLQPNNRSWKLEQLESEIPALEPEKSGLKSKTPLNRDELSLLANKVLTELRLGKQASNYKLVKKSLKRLIELVLSSSK